MDPYHVEALRREIVQASHTLHARGWVANHDGNLSARLDAAGDPALRVLCTPTSVSKGDVRPEWLIVVDEARTVIEGTRAPFGELALHLAAYRARPDIGVVLHAHPPTACGFLVAGAPLPHPFLGEAVVTLGPELPLVPWSTDAEALAAGVADALGRADVALLDRHGVLVVGGGFEQALLRLELVEHLARIALAATTLGGVRPLPAADVARLSAKGRPRSQPARAAAPEPAPTTGAAPTWTPPSGADRSELRSLVEDALRRYR